MSGGDPVELVPSHGGRGGSEVARAILVGAEIFVETVPALAQEAGELGRVEPEGPALARGFEGREQTSRAEERRGIVEDRAVNVCKDDLAGRRRPGRTSAACGPRRCR